jgi:hypothetical protein
MIPNFAHLQPQQPPSLGLFLYGRGCGPPNSFWWRCRVRYRDASTVPRSPRGPAPFPGILGSPPLSRVIVRRVRACFFLLITSRCLGGRTSASAECRH